MKTGIYDSLNLDREILIGDEVFAVLQMLLQFVLWNHVHCVVGAQDQLRLFLSLSLEALAAFHDVFRHSVAKNYVCLVERTDDVLVWAVWGRTMVI
jgi:hypothetical protein